MTTPIGDDLPIRKLEGTESPTPIAPDGLSVRQTGEAAGAERVADQIELAGVPEITISEVGLLPDNGAALLETEVQSLEAQAERVQHLIEGEDAIQPRTAPSAEQWAKANAKLLIDKLLAEVSGDEDYIEAVDSVIEAAAIPLDMAVEYVAHPAEKIVPLFRPEWSEKMEGIANPILAAELAFKVPLTLGKAGTLIYKRVFLEQVKSELSRLKETWKDTHDVELKKKIEKLEMWTKAESSRLKNQGLATVFGALAYAPRAVKTGLALAGHMTQTAGVALAGAGGVISSVLSYVKFRQTNKAVKEQKVWMTLAKEKSFSKGEVSQILEKRKQAFETRKEKHREPFVAYIKELLVSGKSFEEVKSDLQKNGIKLNELGEKEPIDVEDLIEIMEADYDILLDPYVKFKETTAIMARKSIKALAVKKQKNERGFLKFRRAEAFGTFSLAVISTVAVVALKTLLLVGAIVIPATALASTGIGMIALAMAPIALGLIYLAIKKPNYLKTFLKGAQFKLGFYSIPKAIQNFRLQTKKVAAIESAMSVNKISARLAEIEGLMALTGDVRVEDVPEGLRIELSKLSLRSEGVLREEELSAVKEHFDDVKARLEDDRETLQQLQERLEARVKKQEKKVKHWKDKVTPLNQRIAEAKYADFTRASKLVTDVQNRPLNIVDTVIDGILIDETMLDKETRTVLKEQLGINLSAVRDTEVKEEQRQKISQQLKKYLGMTDGEVTQFIKKQQAQLEGAIRGVPLDHSVIRSAFNEVRLEGFEE